MSKGFEQSAGDITVQIIIKRLTPAIKRRDEQAIGRGLRELLARYDSSLVHEAWLILMAEHRWLMKVAVAGMRPSDRQAFISESHEVLAQSLIDAGLRIEDHLRVCDQGLALTHAAIAAIKASGYPGTEFDGLGNRSIDGLGLERSPFQHPLSEYAAPNADIPEHHVNLWAFASLLISAAMNWMPKPPDDPNAATRNLAELVAVASPTTSLSKLMFRARYDDGALMKLCSLTHQGLVVKADGQFCK